MQFISITGRVGGDAETRSTSNNTVTNFNCAVDQGWGDNKQTNWFRVAIWGDRGSKLAQYIRKGEKVAVTGELVIGEYNGKPQYEIRAAEVDPFMSKKADNGDAPRTTSVGNSQDFQRVPAGLDDDDVPFATNDPALEARVR